MLPSTSINYSVATFRYFFVKLQVTMIDLIVRFEALLTIAILQERYSGPLLYSLSD